MDLDSLRSRYRGSAASEYERKRADTKKWHREQEAVSTFLETVIDRVNDPVVLDVPVGTGRFFGLYDTHSIEAVGVDVSEDMLNEARSNVPSGNEDISLRQGDIMDLEALEVEPDVVVCIRFMNWLPLADVEQALRSISKTGPSYLIVGIRSSRTTTDRFWRLVRRAYHFVMQSGEQKTTIHDEDELYQVFGNAGMTIEADQVVDEGRYGSKHIYLLLIDDRSE